MPKKKKRKPKSKKLIPLNVKALGSDICAYPFVEIEWSDIEGDAGWSSTKDLNKIFFFMKKDKKNVTNKVNLVLLKKIGSAIYKLQFNEKKIKLFLKKELIK